MGPKSKAIMPEPVRLYTKAVVLGYKRARTNQYENSSLLKLEGVNQKVDVDYYLGKRVAYIYKAKKEVNGSKFRCIWGKITRHHGNNGVVRASFRTNLPPKAIGGPCRVMMYPSRV